MWLFAEFGFVSVVEFRWKPDVLLVRSRVFDDLTRLRAMALSEAAASGGVGEAWSVGVVLATPERDYPYRMEVGKKLMGRVVSSVVAGINYDNFKERVRGERPRDAIYLRVWAAMRMLTGLTEREPRKREPSGLELYDSGADSE